MLYNSNGMESEFRDPGGFVIPRLEPLPPADFLDPVVEVYKKDVDRTLLRENLALTVEERMEKFQSFMGFLDGVRNARRNGPGATGR